MCYILNSAKLAFEKCFMSGKNATYYIKNAYLTHKNIKVPGIYNNKKTCSS